MFSKSPADRYTIDTSKTTQFSDAWVVLAVILVVAGLILRNVFLTTAAATMLTVAGVAWLWNRYSLRHVHYRRRLSEARAFPGEVLTLTLEVSNSKPIPLTWLVVRDVFPAGLPVDDHELPVNPTSNLVDYTTFWMPAANQKITRSFRLTCRARGYYRFGPATLESGDGFGFFESRATLQRAPMKHVDELAAGDRLIVYPRIYTVEELRLPARNPFGENLSRQTLHEDPLRTAGVREWQQYDDIRHIHWLASARTQELLSRVYEPSEEQQIVIFLNVSTLERHWQGVVPELLERAVSVAGSIAALTLAQRQPTGVIANGSVPGSDQEIRLLPGRSPSQLMHILELLAGVTHFATVPIEVLLQRETPRLPWGATIVVVTPIAHDDLLAALLQITAAGRRVVLITLAEKPPARYLHKVSVLHLPHLVDDLIQPIPVDPSRTEDGAPARVATAPRPASPIARVEARP